MDLTDRKTWDLFKDGRTKGIFQLESQLGRTWAKKLQPDNISELSDLISIIRPGCVSGDTKICTKIYKKTNGNIMRRFSTLKEMFENKDKYKTLISADEKTLEYCENSIEDIFFSGNKEVFRINVDRYCWNRIWAEASSKRNYTLECTADHKLLTPTGWKELRHLKDNERILIWGSTSNKPMRKHITNSRHSPEVKIKNCKGMTYFKEMCHRHYEYKCVFCDWSETSLDCNHIIGNRHTDNSPENLCFMCPNHHRMYSEGTISAEELIKEREKYKLPQGGKHLMWGVFKGKESLGTKDTYDISMKSPHHNFVAGNIVVHNCLKAKMDGKTMANHYIDRRFGLEEVEYVDDSLQEILEDTQGIILYQESCMRIAQKLAGFNLTQSNLLRASIGKKKADLMAKMKKEFLVGCKNTGIVNDEVAEEVFSWIEKSARYSFNKCLCPNSKVLIPQGEILLRDIRVNDYVKGPHPTDTAKSKLYRVIAVYNNGEQDLFRVKFYGNDQTINCTKSHKFLCTDGEVRSLNTIMDQNHAVVLDFPDDKNPKCGKIDHSKLKYLGKQPTMDIEIDSEQHLYYANGVATSNSHGVCYAMNAYHSAWFKANYTHEFFLAYLFYASEKQDPHQEIYELVSEAKLFNIEVKLPNLNHYAEKFNIHKKDIYFGIKDIKSMTGVNGDKVVSALTSLEEYKKCGDCNWMDVLLHLSTKINKTAFKALCSIGFFTNKNTNISRNRALFEFNSFKQLTAAETRWVVDNYKERQWESLTECFADLAPLKKEGGGTSKDTRRQLIENEMHFLKNPPYDMDDDPGWLIDQEVSYLGCPISLAKVDSADTSAANTTCKDIMNGRKGKNLCIAANISRMADYTITKEGQNKGKIMSFLTIEDESCSLDGVVAFPESREKYRFLLYEGNNVLLCGDADGESLIVNKVFEI